MSKGSMAITQGALRKRTIGARARRHVRQIQAPPQVHKQASPDRHHSHRARTRYKHRLQLDDTRSRAFQTGRCGWPGMIATLLIVLSIVDDDVLVVNILPIGIRLPLYVLPCGASWKEWMVKRLNEGIVSEGDRQLPPCFAASTTILVETRDACHTNLVGNIVHSHRVASICTTR
ncbi:hypothetical protein OBBRIDRAFT_382609 [Obba rivulosa]|uniref:Uncharacterized protein n=1 Tax=Obba rivulosa TaxID=1052685 RepID=A0A8E2DFF2_9APHY|nr:hypothetical protein OBBRIDRAFT_382609 [Obba rivulosa]